MMECRDGGPVCVAASLAITMLTVGLIFCVIRLLRGPSTPDRVVALDLASLHAVGLITVYAVQTREVSFLSGGLLVGLVAFLGAVAFARYLERKVDR